MPADMLKAELFFHHVFQQESCIKESSDKNLVFQEREKLDQHFQPL